MKRLPAVRNSERSICGSPKRTQERRTACSGWAVEAAPEGQGHLAQGFNPGWPGLKAMSARAAERFGSLLRLLRPPTWEGASPSPTLSLRLWGPAADFDGTLRILPLQSHTFFLP